MTLKGSLNQEESKLKLVLALGGFSFLILISLGMFFTQTPITGSAVQVSDVKTTTITTTTTTTPTTTTTTVSTTSSTSQPPQKCSNFGYSDYCGVGFTCQTIKPTVALTCCQCVPVQTQTSTTSTTTTPVATTTTTTVSQTTTTTMQTQYQSCIGRIFDEECGKYNLIYTDYSSTIGFITCTDDGAYTWEDIMDETKYLQVHTQTRTLQIKCGTYQEPTGKEKCMEDYFEELCEAENLIYTDYSNTMKFVTCTDDGMYIFNDITDSSKYKQVYISQVAIDSRCPT